MAVTLNTSVTGKLIWLDDGTDIYGSVNLNAGATTPSLIVVGVCLGCDFGAMGAAVTWNGVTMTNTIDVNNVFGQTLICTLPNGASGSHTLQLYFAGMSGVNAVGNANLINYSGAQVGANQNSGIGADSTPTTTVSGLAGSSQVFSACTFECLFGAAPTLTVGGGETQRLNASNGTLSINRIRSLASTQAAGGDGVMDWSSTTSDNWSIGAIEIAAIPSGAPSMCMMGVGC